MDQASPQCMDDDSSLAAYRQDERLPKVVVHFCVFGSTVSGLSNMLIGMPPVHITFTAPQA